MTRHFLFVLWFSALCDICSLGAQNDNFVVTFNKSIACEKNNDIIGALRSMKELKDSTRYEAILRYGWLNYKAGFKKKSISYYNRAIAMKPNAVEPRMGLSYPAYLLEAYEELKANYQKIIEIDPNNKSANFNLALVYYYNKEYDKALPYLLKMEEFYPFDYDNGINLAWTYLRLDKKAEAEKYFKIVLLYSPFDALALEGLTAISASSTDSEPMELAFQKSYELSNKSDYKAAGEALKAVYDKNNYAINLRLGWLSYMLGQYTDAANYYKIANGLEPKSIEAKQGCALALSGLGNKNEEMGFHKSILSLDANNTLALYNAGKIYFEQKDYQSAAKQFEAILSLYPFDYSSLLMMGWTHYQLGNTSQSRDMFNKVLAQAANDKSAILGLNSRPLEELRNQEKPIKAK